MQQDESRGPGGRAVYLILHGFTWTVDRVSSGSSGYKLFGVKPDADVTTIKRGPTKILFGPAVPTRTRMTRKPCPTAKSEIEVLNSQRKVLSRGRYRKLGK